jgi:hypothetical protein
MRVDATLSGVLLTRKEEVGSNFQKNRLSSSAVVDK